jgi:hypothetical protein
MLLIDSDAQRRTFLAQQLRTAGLTVDAVERIADIERWPIGDVVIVEPKFFTPLWKHVGATHVIVLAESADVGALAVAQVLAHTSRAHETHAA